MDVFLMELQNYWAIRKKSNSDRKHGYISKNHPGYIAIHDPNDFVLFDVKWIKLNKEPVNGGNERHICQLDSFEECIRRIKNSGINIHILMAQQEIK